MSSARQQWFQLDAFVEDQRASTLGATDLVRGNSHRVHAGPVQLTEVDRDLAERLHGIGMHPRSGAPQRLGQFGHRLQHPGLVIGMHQRNHHRAARREPGETPDCQAVGIDRQAFDRPAQLRKLARRLDDARVLGGTDAQQPRRTACRRALDEQVVRLGSATGKNHLGWVCADRRSDLLPRAIHRIPGRPAVFVPARRIAELLAQPGQHRVQRCRFNRRRRVVVEVNGGEHEIQGRRVRP